MVMGLFGNRDRRAKKDVELGPDLFKRIEKLLSTHWQDEDSTGIAYFSSEKSEKQTLDVVGESFCQDEIKANFKPDKWVYGLLVPEQSNKSDPKAVALYLITKDYSVTRVGYLKKEIASKVSQKIANLMVNDGLVIPVLAMPKKAEGESDNCGIRAYAMTDYLTF